MIAPEQFSTDEQEFYDLVMLGETSILPGKNSFIKLERVQTPEAAAHALRMMGMHGMDINFLADMEFKYDPSAESFYMKTLVAHMQNGRRARFTHTPYGYSGQSGKIFNESHMDQVLSRYNFPSLAPPTSDFEQYNSWTGDLLDHAQSWHVRDRQSLRSKTVGGITARLEALKEKSLYRDGDIYSKVGMEFTITDKARSRSKRRAHDGGRYVTTHTSFVGEETTRDRTEFTAHDERRVYDTRTQKPVERIRSEVFLTPHHREVWVQRLVDPTTNIPYASPTLE